MFIFSISGDDDIDWLNNTLESLVKVFSFKLQLQQGTVHLVHHQDWLDTLTNGLTEHCLSLYTNTWQGYTIDKLTYRKTDQVESFHISSTIVNIVWKTLPIIYKANQHFRSFSEAHTLFNVKETLWKEKVCTWDSCQDNELFASCPWAKMSTYFVVVNINKLTYVYILIYSDDILYDNTLWLAMLRLVSFYLHWCPNCGLFCWWTKKKKKSEKLRIELERTHFATRIVQPCPYQTHSPLQPGLHQWHGEQQSLQRRSQRVLVSQSGWSRSQSHPWPA